LPLLSSTRQEREVLLLGSVKKRANRHWGWIFLAEIERVCWGEEEEPVWVGGRWGGTQKMRWGNSKSILRLSSLGSSKTNQKKPGGSQKICTNFSGEVKNRVRQQVGHPKKQTRATPKLQHKSLQTLAFFAHIIAHARTVLVRPPINPAPCCFCARRNDLLQAKARPGGDRHVQ